jgi:hypothetical protein
MPAVITSSRLLPRGVLVAAAAVGGLAAASILLWARYGVAVFHEIVSAGLALCF